MKKFLLLLVLIFILGTGGFPDKGPEAMGAGGKGISFPSGSTAALSPAFTQRTSAVAPIPTFAVPFELSGLSRLPSTLTVNGTTLTSRLDCDASGVSGTVLTCNTGQTFDEAGSGASPTVVAAPFTDGTDAIDFKGAKYYSSTAADVADLAGDEDFVFEVVAKGTNLSVYERVFQAGNAPNGGAPPEGVTLATTPGGRLGLFFQDGTASFIMIETDTTHCSTSDQWCHYLFFIDRDENSTNGGRVFANGTYSASTNPYALNGDTIDNPNATVQIGQGAGTLWRGPIATLRMWTCTGCFAGGATNATQWLAVAAERFQRLTGSHPSHASGSAIATVRTRASTATMPIHDITDDVTRLFAVGPNWPRVAAWPSGGWGADPTGNGTQIVGYYSEAQATNLALQSEDIATTWTNIGASTETVNAVAGPDGETTADAINGSGTAAQGVSQSVTLTATSYTLSTFAKAGAQSWAYLEVPTIANVSSYFNLSTCTTGTVGAAALAYVEDWGNGWCRIILKYTGTVAAHDHDLQCASADAGQSYAGASADCYFVGAQVEAIEYPSSYVRTKTAQVTRSADNLYYAASGNYDSTNGVSIHTAVVAPNYAPTTGQTVFSATGPSTNDHVFRMQQAGTSTLHFYGRYNSAVQWDSHVARDTTSGEQHDLGVTAKTDEACLYDDGVLSEACDTSVTLPTGIANLFIGNYGSSSEVCNCMMPYVRIYPGKVTP
jgi:hypothetical protein